MGEFQVTVYRSGVLLGEPLRIDRAVIVGRQDGLAGDPPPPSLRRMDKDNHQQIDDRLIVASMEMTGISRTWFRLWSDEPGTFVVENVHPSYELAIQEVESLPPSQSRAFSEKVTCDLGHQVRIDVEPLGDAGFEILGGESEEAFQSLQSVPPIPGHPRLLEATVSLQSIPPASAAAAVDMLRMALEVVQTAAGSDAFFQAAVDAVLKIAELDRAMVLLRSSAEGLGEVAFAADLPDGWALAAEQLSPRVQPSDCPAISTSVLARVHSPDHRTMVHQLNSEWTPMEAPSLEGIRCVVASPILNKQGSLVGVLYGDRWSRSRTPAANQISPLEATLVEVLAGAVAGGIARKDEERRRGNLSGFFSPRVADLLASSPEMLEGQDATVSVLFCDIRGFSSVTEKLGPPQTIRWINDVLSELSQCVVDTDGVLVDYVGDELMAMWGAPGEQTDHAQRAVHTTIAMLEAIEVLRQRWASLLPGRFGAGIGVNTGIARVGNVGSRLKFKYGVLGNTVNVGSRLQAATKQLGVDTLISDESARQAGTISQARRIAKLAVVGIEQPVDVYQVTHEINDRWQRLRGEYELALDDYESQRFGETTRRLGVLIQDYPDDRPCRQLLARAAEQLNRVEDDEFTPIWKLSRK